jgi:hypothetical protein
VHRLVIQIGIHVFLYQVGHDVYIVVELTHAGVIPLGPGDLLHLVFKVVAEVDDAVDGAEAVLFHRCLDQFLCDRFG